MKDANEMKNKASKLINKLAKGLEDATHKVIDKTSELSSDFEEKLSGKFEYFVTGIQEMVDYIQEKEVSDLVDGDIVVSKKDITKTDGTVLYHAGEVFEFFGNVVPFLKGVPLYTPDLKSAVKYGRISEMKNLHTVPSLFNPLAVDEYISRRKIELNAEANSSKKKEPAGQPA